MSPRKVGGRSLLIAIGSCVALLGPAAGAQANNARLRATLKAGIVRLDHDEARIADAFGVLEKSNKAKPAIRAIRHEVRDLHALDAKLASEKASTAKGRRGKAKVVKGIALISNAYASLARVLQRLSHGKKVSKARLQATRKADQKGRANLLAGIKLLGG